MYTPLLRNILSCVVAVAVLSMCNTAFAQGTANGPVTQHDIDPGPIVFIGDAANPIKIDLDPLGPPWTKEIFDPNGLLANGGLLDIVETIINAGTESWFDWHEHILPNANGVVPGVWTSVKMSINGNPIVFNDLGLNTPNLWLDNFSQPVLPGDILTINKQVDVFPTSGGIPGTPVLVIEEYPTPEPASAALMALGLTMCGRPGNRRLT